MRTMAVDWGDKRLGIAMSDITGAIANPLPFIKRKGDKSDIERIVNLAREHDVDCIVVGIPLDQDGSEGKSALAAKKFSGKLAEYSNITVDTVDERYSTHAAERSLLEADLSRSRRKELRDSVAAAWFLQTYLDAKSFKEEI